MKKVVILILLVLGVLLAFRGAAVVLTNFHNAGPGVETPPVETSKINEKQSPLATPKAAVNTTGFPLSLPTGFSIAIVAKGLAGPRVLAIDPVGNLLVSIPSQGRVVALRDTNGDGSFDETKDLAKGLNKPHGLAFHGGKLYVAETNKVAVYDYDANTLGVANKKKIIDLPAGGNHFTRTIGFGPDGKLYISVGSTCNVCLESDWRRAKILVANPDGTNLADFASGLRNPVFFTWHPVTHELWTTEMGRDNLGDDIPPDEINIIKQGKFYGWPYCYGKNVHDAAFDTSEKSIELCKNAEPSYIDIPAHSAPLGLAFVPSGSKWPKEYWNNLFVSYHGSWNRSKPTGYKVVRYKLDDKGTVLGVEDFITGLLTPSGAVGRPVDILIDPTGFMFISDDKAGVVYRVSV